MNGLCVSPGHALQRLDLCAVNGQYSGTFGVGAGVHLGAVLSPLFFILVLEAPLRELCPGSFSMLMTWCSTRTPRRSAFPSSMCRRLAWKVKNSMSTWKRPSSQSPMLALMSSRYMASIPALYVVEVSATTPSSARCASSVSIRGAAASLINWWPNKLCLHKV